jgi:hypothetical protein
MPALFEIVPATGDTAAELPDPDLPYYVMAREGLFLHRKTQIGKALIKEKTMPKSLGGVGQAAANGLFTWSGPKVPATIIAQATHFFRRIYDKYQTEAEVLITMHNETGAFRLFVPFQRVNGAGVKSIYEPSHIDKNYTVVGTLHSHCYFSAFHSGTDSADASDMDGIHFTLGMLQNNPPEIVCMVAMNGVEFHYKNVSEIAELDYTADTAPEWWDQYVYPAATQSAKPKGLNVITQAQWDEFRGLVNTRKPHGPTGPKATHHYNWPNYQPNRSAWLPSEDRLLTLSDIYVASFDRGDYGPLTESRLFNSRQRKELRRHHFTSKATSLEAEQVRLDHALDEALDTKVLDLNEYNTCTASQMDDITYWQRFFIERLSNLATILSILGVTLDYKVTLRKPTPTVDGQVGMIEMIAAQKDD